jgi:predicted RNA-binding Zn-ribbon protein involved in translation (DUF1610 family)
MSLQNRVERLEQAAGVVEGVCACAEQTITILPDGATSDKCPTCGLVMIVEAGRKTSVIEPCEAEV